MSASYAMLLHELEPDIKIYIFERLEAPALESTGVLNNAGTGHAAYCELNYTPIKIDGSINIDKATLVTKQFEQSKSYWAHLVEKYKLIRPEDFIHRVPHISFVWGDENVSFLRKRFEAMQSNPFFEAMVFSDNASELKEWMPLVMQDRTTKLSCAATYMKEGTDVNFESLTNAIFKYLNSKYVVKIFLKHELRDINRNVSNEWDLCICDLNSEEEFVITTPLVFVGAGGGALDILDKSGIDEADGYGGFPISGQWLRCTNQAVINQHNVKVYGKAELGSPPMSVPHLDTRFIFGKKELLFGPFAGLTTKFLKEGSKLDLAASLDWDNILSMLSAGWHNLDLTKYLLEQSQLTHEERIMILRDYYPNANGLDWELCIAGQRVQIIKKDEDQGGILEFGTEIVASKDGSITAVLGASPGASVSVSIILEILERSMPYKYHTDEWQTKLKNIIPFMEKIIEPEMESIHSTKYKNNKILGLN